MSYVRHSFVRKATFIPLAVVSGIASMQPAAAQFGPCRSAAPTTPEVNLVVSDLDRAVDWYRKNVGLAEDQRWFDFGRGGISAVRMKQNGAGVTLLFSPAQRGLSSMQSLCFVLDSPLAPAIASKPIYLVDPDGTSVELAPRSANTDSTPSK